MSPQQLRNQRKEYDRLYRSVNYCATYGNGVRKCESRIVVPADVRREEFHTPCLLCGAARACRHRGVSEMAA
jgi:hypothetical protein